MLKSLKQVYLGNIFECVPKLNYYFIQTVLLIFDILFTLIVESNDKIILKAFQVKLTIKLDRDGKVPGLLFYVFLALFIITPNIC